MKISPFATLAALLIAIAASTLADDTPVPAADETKRPCCPSSKGPQELGPPPASPVLVKGEFDLINAKTGKPSNKASFDGSYRLVFFGFTHCRVVCPIGLNLMGQIMKELDQQAAPTPRVVPIFISIDPDRDPATRMKDYLGHFDERIVGLTGSDEKIARAMKSFRMEAPKMEIRSETDYQFDHPALIMLMDRRGNYLKSIPSSGQARDLVNELLKAMAEDQTSRP